MQKLALPFAWLQGYPDLKPELGPEDHQAKTAAGVELRRRLKEDLCASPAQLGLLDDKAVRTFFHQLCIGVEALHTPKHDLTCESHLLRHPLEWSRDLRVPGDLDSIRCRNAPTIECSACGVLCPDCDKELHESASASASARTHVNNLKATFFDPKFPHPPARVSLSSLKRGFGHLDIKALNLCLTLHPAREFQLVLVDLGNGNGPANGPRPKSSSALFFSFCFILFCFCGCVFFFFFFFSLSLSLSLSLSFLNGKSPWIVYAVAT
jgi:hypothetical protein